MLSRSLICPGKWQRNKYVGVSLVGKTLAVMGFGKVGSEVARRAKGLGMHVIAHDPYAPADRARAIWLRAIRHEKARGSRDLKSVLDGTAQQRPQSTADSR